MGNKQIAIICNVTEEQREILSGMLGGFASLTFVGDASAEDRRQTLASSEILIAWSPSKELQPNEYDAIRNVQLIQLITAGVDHLPFSLLPRTASIAGNVGAFAGPMSEHVLAMTLALAKRLPINHLKLAAGEFDQVTPNKALNGMVCGILGFGGIGRASARLMHLLGMKIYAVNTSGKSSDPVDFIGNLSSLEHVLRNCDVLVISLSLTRLTRGLIGARELSWMKSDAILINVARGEIIDENALYDRLKSCPNFTAGIDTWWIEPSTHGEFRTSCPFFDLPNFLGSPHNSPIVPGTLGHATRFAAENIVRFLKREEIKGVVRREEYE